MIRRKSKFLAVFLSVLMLTASACNKDKVMDKDGNILEYTQSDIKDMSGYFVRIEHDSSDVVFQPLLNPSKVGTVSFSKSVESIENLGSRYILMSDRDNLIPIITGNNLLIYVDKDSAIPSSFQIEKMEDCGFTFGGRFYAPENSKGLRIVTSGFSKENFVENSDMKDQWDDKSNLSLYSLDMIGETQLGANNIDENGIFQGLEYGKTYEFQCYVGTAYDKVSVECDTHYFKSEKVINMLQRDCINKTKNGFVIMSLPKDLESGYYLINNSYLFYYDAENVSGIPVTEQFSYLEPEETSEEATETTDSIFPYDELPVVNEDLDDYEEEPS